jgi:hypothetical protein
MCKGVWIGLFVTLLFAAPGVVTAQGDVTRDTVQRDSSRDTVEMASVALVREGNLFTLELDIGVFVERTCITVEPLENVCHDILELLREARLELVDEMRTAVEEELDTHLSERMEDWVTERIGNSILRATEEGR